MHACMCAGVYTFADGRKYEGQYRNNMKNGFGVYTWADGTRYDVCVYMHVCMYMWANAARRDVKLCMGM
jgi:hypothetical protein